MTFRNPHPKLAVATLCTALCVPASHGQAQSISTLAPIQVKASDAPYALQPSLAQEAARLAEVPGGTNLIIPGEHVRSITLRDALDYQPGIVIQEFFGGIDQPRLTIRGSGIQSNPVNRGILLLDNGLPLNEADGSFIIGFLEPRDASLISVRRGANATAPGASTLGGEMDTISYTGTEHDVISVEGGSYQRFSTSGAKGFQGEQWDGRVSISHDASDGYRHHSASERTALRANAGFDTDGFQNRSYLSYTKLQFEIPNVIPEQRLYDDPQAVMGDHGEPLNIYQRDPRRRSEQLRLANRSYWGTETLNQQFGLYWQTIDDTFTSPQLAYPTTGHTWGAQWQLAGKVSALDYRFALDWQRTDMNRDIYAINAQGSRASHNGDYDLKASNYSALLGLNWHLLPTLDIVADLRYARAERDATNALNSSSLNQRWSYATPKLGLVWRPSANIRLYGNLSRSAEAPTFWEIVPGTTAGPQSLNLQRARTLEVGGEGAVKAGNSQFIWTLSLYRSKVNDELMAVSNANGTLAGVYNYAAPTIHQGLEAGVHGSFAAFGQSTIDYRLAYTFSDFRFDGGEFDGNRIAGVPRHMFSGELMYRHGNWSLGPNVRWLAVETPTTHANNPAYYQNAYAIWGFKARYTYGKRWQAYIAADNIADKIYASSYVIRDNVNLPNQPTYLSGNGRNFTAGLSYLF